MPTHSTVTVMTTMVVATNAKSRKSTALATNPAITTASTRNTVSTTAPVIVPAANTTKTATVVGMTVGAIETAAIVRTTVGATITNAIVAMTRAMDQNSATATTSTVAVLPGLRSAG